MGKKILLVFLAIAAASAAVWALVHFTNAKRYRLQQTTADSSNLTNTSGEAWVQGIQKIKERRADAGGPIETPPELRHYSDRHWFLATQVAEIEKHNIHTCQDFFDLAELIRRGEIVAVPPVTDTYLLYGVGEKADDEAFTRYEDDRSVEVYNTFAPEVRFSIKHASQHEVRNYDALYTLAKNFGGRSYNLDTLSDRQTLKLNMLRSLRPEALKIMEEIASAYHRQFDRLLPVSSLVRPEQYQRALSKVNRNAVLIDTPPHSTGLAFDIDYRYMGAGEQTFVMAELARLEKEGKIEVIRESNANYHVFAFLNGTRPNDELIMASIEKAKAPVEATHHATAKSASVKNESRKAQRKIVKQKKRRT
jgi:Family of unknown function (DUF5715)